MGGGLVLPLRGWSGVGIPDFLRTWNLVCVHATQADWARSPVTARMKTGEVRSMCDTGLPVAALAWSLVFCQSW